MQRQLSIFDSLQPLDTPESLIEPGDWVKLQRKTVTAPYWKKGESVQVEGAHPTNGSVKFWSERSESWAYLHPEDFTKTVPPIVLVAESEPVPGDSATSQPIALVAESEPIPGEIDSATSQPIILVAESGSAPLVAESEPIPGEIDSATKSVSTYRPKGTARGGEYFRFVYRAGTKTKSVHIPGGNTGNSLAQQRAAEVMELATAGVPAVEICDRIRSWSGRTATPK
ncbi:hypothetical protein [Microcoleus sp. AT9b-C3]|uniref:hypothetical protein n=1 Tax=Microcoleus sp. AT9b-C3 TaxID=2818629 RepID=UPI002FD62113